MATRQVKPDVLGTGSSNYGYGILMRGFLASKAGSDIGAANFSRGLMVGGEPAKKMGLRSSNDPEEELKRMGNECCCQNGNYSKALTLYEKAIAIYPSSAAYHFNLPAALMGLKRLLEAVRECEEVIMLDPRYLRAHHRLGSLLLSRGNFNSNTDSHACCCNIFAAFDRHY